MKRSFVANREQGLQLIGPVMALHAAAFLLGYVLCKVLGFNEKTARTVSIETGEPNYCLHSTFHFPMPYKCVHMKFAL